MSAEALSKALAKAATLLAADQEPRVRNLGAYLEDLATLRAMIDEAELALDAGEGREIDIGAFLAHVRATTTTGDQTNPNSASTT